MRSSPMPFKPVRISQQRGVSLFFALVCLVSIMLAAVALVRSVDTSTLISGNLAFQQSATASSDAGTEAAIAWLASVEVLMKAASKNVLMDADHTFNLDDGAKGYWASLNPAKSLTASTGPAAGRFLWDLNDSKALAMDSSGNTTRYIIQRMCTESGKAARDAGCMYSGAAQDKSGRNVKLPQEVCDGAGCPLPGQTPQIRITSRTDGPKNTRSYVQAFVY
jgi:type IV pilus assembly protein PilX